MYFESSTADTPMCIIYLCYVYCKLYSIHNKGTNGVPYVSPYLIKKTENNVFWPNAKNVFTLIMLDSACHSAPFSRTRVKPVLPRWFIRIYLNYVFLIFSAFLIKCHRYLQYFSPPIKCISFAVRTWKIVELCEYVWKCCMITKKFIKIYSRRKPYSGNNRS